MKERQITPEEAETLIIDQISDLDGEALAHLYDVLFATSSRYDEQSNTIVISGE